MSRCIDADALEKILEKIPAADIKNMGGQAYVLVKLSQVFNVIDNQPTIEPQRKKGKWINHRCDDGHHIADCDQCGHSLQWFDDDIPKYCCECGADMREPEDIPMEYFESGGR